MFDKRITDSDRFTDLPNSSKALYFMAGMSADDRGFFQPRRLQKMNGFTDDDFKVLIAKGYFIPFESGVMVITDWNKNNWLDKRRITETEYIEELKLLRLINERYEINDGCLASAEPMLRENSIEQNRIVENRIEQQYSSLDNVQDLSKEMLHCNNDVTKCNSIKDIDIEKDIEIDKEQDEAVEICNIIEKNFNRTISPIEYQKIQVWLEDFNKEVLIKAINEAVLNNKKTFSYINGILKNWKTNGEVPDWFDKEIPRKEITEEEKREMEDLIKNF